MDHPKRSRQYPGRRRAWAIAIISRPAGVSRKTIAKGNRRRSIRRVPNSCKGHRAGFCAIRRIAPSISSRKRSAARRLRSGYQRTAASASSRAAGWIGSASMLNRPAGHEGAGVRRARRRVLLSRCQFVQAGPESRVSTLPRHLPRSSDPGSQLGNQLAPPAPPAEGQEPPEAVRRGVSP
jgi:hypothetical protein